MKNVKNLNEFTKLRERQKIKWIERNSKDVGSPNIFGVVVDEIADIIVSYSRINGRITKISAEKFTDEYQKAERETLAEMAVAHPN